MEFRSFSAKHSNNKRFLFNSMHDLNPFVQTPVVKSGRLIKFKSIKRNPIL